MKNKNIIKRIYRLETILKRVETSLSNLYENFAKCKREMMECGCRVPRPLPKYFRGLIDADSKNY